MTDPQDTQRVPFEQVTTEECPNCSGAGELYKIEHEYHPDQWDAGVSLFERVDDGAWSMAGSTKMCPRCEGFGRVNKYE